MIRINVLRSLRLHPVTASVVALVTLGLGLAFLLRGKPMYEVSSSIYVAPSTPVTLHLDPGQQYAAYDSYMQEKTQAILNYSVISKAIDSLPAGAWKFPGESEQSAVDRLQRSLEVKRIGETYEMGITLAGYDPKHLADVVNAVANTFTDDTKKEQFYGRDESLETLRQNRAELQKELDAKLQEQASITSSLGMASVSGGVNPYDSQIGAMRGELVTARDNRIAAEAQLSALESGSGSTPNASLDAAADEIIQSDPQLVAQKTNLAQKRVTLVDQLSKETAINPERKTTEAQLAQIDQSLQTLQNDLRSQAAARLRQKAAAEVSRTTQIENKLMSDMQSATGAASSAAPKFQRAQELTTQITSLEARFSEVDNRIGDLELEESSAGPIHVSSPALPPLGPQPNKKRKMLPALFPAAILLGVLAAVLCDLFDPHLYNGGDLEGALGFAPIGMLLNDSDVTQRVYDECVLRLAAGIDHSIRVAGARTFVFTGVNSGVGTTSIVENLGSALARLGRKTISIDASGHTAPVAYVTIGPDAGNVSGNGVAGNGTSGDGAASAKPGEDGPTSEEAKLQRSRLMAELMPNPSAPLSGYVVRAFQELSKDYEIILIDAAPILISAESEYLARCADVTILVAEAGRTTKRRVTRAARLMERLDVGGAAAIINKVRLLRVEDNVRDDLKEFEARMGGANMRWRPQRPAQNRPVGAPGNFNGTAPNQAETVSFHSKGN
ncbi:GumC family protein [Silvibacterium sp.]|uniref:GumC family protein n=1 Tax=Silvibacterium sp. TaxID=1964179 RepID=UPI0039E407CD